MGRPKKENPMSAKKKKAARKSLTPMSKTNWRRKERDIEIGNKTLKIKSHDKGCWYANKRSQS